MNALQILFKPFMSARNLSAISFTLLILTFSTGCSKLDIEEGTPESVKDKIEDFNKSSSCDDAKVDEYSFQESTVFVFNQGTCGADLSSEVTDSKANSMGFLGGISGNTKINGEDFENAVFIKTVWEK